MRCVCSEEQLFTVDCRYLDKNSIGKLETNTFNGLSFVSFLFVFHRAVATRPPATRGLSNNKITLIEPGVFAHMPSLGHLYDDYLAWARAALGRSLCSRFLQDNSHMLVASTAFGAVSPSVL